MNPPAFAMQPKRPCNKMSPLGCNKETFGEVIHRRKDVWGDLMQASQNTPHADRVALRPTKKDAFDLTSACVFLDDTQY